MYIKSELHLAENLTYADFEERNLWGIDGFVCFGNRGPETGEKVVYLDHSCSEWVIGGKAEVKNLIEDLQLLLEKM